MKYSELNVNYKKPHTWRQPTKQKLDYGKTKSYCDILAEIADFDDIKGKVKDEINHVIGKNVEASLTKGEMSQRLSTVFEHFGKSVLLTDDYDEKYLLGQTNKNTLNKKLQPWCKNLLYNIPRVVDSPPLQRLFNKYKDVPAFVVLAGPSLKNNIEELKRVGDKGIIIATDTAFRPCIEAGVKVHLVMAHDANPQGMRFFLPKEHPVQNPLVSFNDMPFDYLVKVVLEQLKFDPSREMFKYDAIGAFVDYCHPLTIESFSGSELAFYRVMDPSLPVYEIMGACTNLTRKDKDSFSPEEKGYIVGGSSVGHTATYLAVSLNCNPITIIGCDLSYPKGMTYVEGASNQKDASKQKLITVKDLSGREVGTNLSMFSYRLVFTRALPQISENMGKTFYNATEHSDGSPAGILNAGAEPKRLRDIIDKECKEDFTTVKNMLQLLQEVKKNNGTNEK